MPLITLVRTCQDIPSDAQLSIVRQFLFGLFKGATDADDKRWNRFWRMATCKEAGEMFGVERMGNVMCGNIEGLLPPPIDSQDALAVRILEKSPLNERAA